MASQVQTSNNSDSFDTAIAYGSNVVAGNLGIVWFRTIAGTLTGLTDTLGSTWTQVGTAIVLASGSFTLWYTVFGSSGANTVTFTGVTGGQGCLQEVNGLGAGATLDSTNQATGTSTTAAASGNISPAVATWVFSGLGLANYPSIAPTPGSGFTLLGTGNKYCNEYQNAASGTYNGQYTLPENNDWGSIIGAFKAGAAAGNPPKPWQLQGGFGVILSS